tara:strand:- start:715 stop:1980 length:1266 start_codon:yes stop_codon:yes gene_type:complete
MALNPRIILDTRRKTKKGFPIKVIVNDYRISLNEFSEKEHFEGENVNRKHPDFRRLFNLLNKKKIELYDTLDYCEQNNLSDKDFVEIIKSGLKNKEAEILALELKLKQLRGDTGITFCEFAKIRIEEKQNLGESTQIYDEVIKLVEAFEDVNLNNITYEWLNSFINHRFKSGTGRGGINTYLRTMRAIYKEAQRRTSLQIKQDNPFSGIIKTGDKKEPISLTQEEIESLLSYSPEKITRQQKASQIRNLDIFKFQLFIGGHDLVDIANLKKSNIKNGRIIFKRYKNRNKPNGGKQINNKLFDECLEIINTYSTEEKRIFSFIPDPNLEKSKYKYFVRAYNKSLQSISKKLNLNEHVKSKSPRYIFRSRCGELFISDIIASKLQGHSLQGMTFSYQSNLPNNILDKEHRKIIDSFLCENPPS